MMPEHDLEAAFRWFRHKFDEMRGARDVARAHSERANELWQGAMNALALAEQERDEARAVAREIWGWYCSTPDADMETNVEKHHPWLKEGR